MGKCSSNELERGRRIRAYLRRARMEEIEQRLRETMERVGREDGTIWGPETSDDDPYGDEDKEYEGLE